MPSQWDADVAEGISVEIARIHEDSYGQAPRQIKTYFLDDSIVCIVEIELLPHERTIMSAGAGNQVRKTRSSLEEAIRASFIASVEHMTGRQVVGFLSDTHLDPPFSIEFFRLGPRANVSDLRA